MDRIKKMKANPEVIAYFAKHPINKQVSSLIQAIFSEIPRFDYEILVSNDYSGEQELTILIGPEFDLNQVRKIAQPFRQDIARHGFNVYIGEKAQAFDFKLKFEDFDKKVYYNLTNEQIRQKVLINCQIENDQLTYEDIWTN